MKIKHMKIFPRRIIRAVNYYTLTHVVNAVEKVCGRSMENVHGPEIHVVQCMLPLLLMNKQTREIILVRWAMVFPSFLTDTAYLSCMFRGSLSHARFSPTSARKIDS